MVEIYNRNKVTNVKEWCRNKNGGIKENHREAWDLVIKCLKQARLKDKIEGDSRTEVGSSLYNLAPSTRKEFLNKFFLAKGTMRSDLVEARVLLLEFTVKNLRYEGVRLLIDLWTKIEMLNIQRYCTDIQFKDLYMSAEGVENGTSRMSLIALFWSTVRSCSLLFWQLYQRFEQ